MNPLLARQAFLTRPQFFGRSAMGLGTAALASLLNRDAFGAERLMIGSEGQIGFIADGFSASMVA